MNDGNAAGSGYFVSAPWRSSGKTIFSIGLARAAMQQKLAVQTFKKGPDYIDPLWLATASGSGCYNIDPYIQQNQQWLNTYREHVSDNTLAIVEGTMGLHDGLERDGSDSNASVAKALGLPVILVVDCRGMHRTVAALINGIQQFDSELAFAGVVLNRVRSTRHEGKIASALEEHSDLELIGSLPDKKDVHIEEKQLGLTPVTELEQVNASIDRAAELVTGHCDVQSLFAGFSAAKSTRRSKAVNNSGNVSAQIKIGVAQDEAFHFYYQNDLDAFASLGVDLVPVSPIKDTFPEDLDGLIIGGGFPERHASRLADNVQFRQGLRSAIDRGLAVHAECAGLMYLCSRLLLEGGGFDMVGVFDGEVTMCRKPQGRGYMKLQRHDCDREIRAHEFHHSEIRFETGCENIYAVLRGHGIDGQNDGVVYKNAHASYAHFRQTEEYRWVDRFVQRVNESRE